MGLGRWIDPFPDTFLLFDLKMEHFGAVFKLDSTEETRTQLPHTGYAYGDLVVGDIRLQRSLFRYYKISTSPLHTVGRTLLTAV